MKKTPPALPHKRSHQWIDLVNLEECLAVAKKIRRNPRLMRIPHANLRRWRKANRGLGDFQREWLRILESNSWPRVLEILTQDNDEGQRLRQGDPFIGILTERQRLYYLRTDEKFKRTLADRIARRIALQKEPSLTSRILAWASTPSVVRAVKSIAQKHAGTLPHAKDAKAAKFGIIPLRPLRPLREAKFC